MNRSVLTLLLAGAAVATSPAARADSMRCEGGIVSVGDRKIDLLGKCGEPSVLDQRVDKRWQSGEGSAQIVEVWSYNFGANRFLEFVTVIDGKVVAIKSGGYGYSPEALRPGRRSRCESTSPRVGDRKVDLLARCGEPAVSDSRVETRGDDTSGYTVQIDVWTYNFGPQSFIEIVTFENGKVVGVEDGGYGYAH